MSNDVDNQLKKKILELLTISDVIKKLNLSLDLDIGTIIDTFLQSSAGLFLIEKSALILFMDMSKTTYVQDNDKNFEKEINEMRGQIEEIYLRLKEKQGCLLANNLEENWIKSKFRAAGIELLVPMFLRKELKGIYLVGNRINKEAYQKEEIDFLFAFANQGIVSIENAHFFQLLQQHMKELVVANEITAAINAGLDTETLLDMVMGALLEMLGAHAGFIVIFGGNKEVLFFIHRGLDEQKRNTILKSRDTAGIINKSLNLGSDDVFTFYTESASFAEKDIFMDDSKNPSYWFGRCLFIRKENMVGVVGLSKKEGEMLSDKEVSLFLTLTNQFVMIVLNARLYELAITDGLTGLFVHRYFEQRLKEEMSRARRYSYSISVIMMDVDQFKRCNDIFGHEIGNMVIKKVGSIINLSIRKNEDIPCRWGGDEFAIILPETDKKGALILAERIRKNIEILKFYKDGKPINVSISAGIASFPADAVDEKDLIDQADNLLYQVKKAGGNKVFLK